MPEFDSSGVTINYIDEGSGPVIVLVHGFAASIKTNWRGPGIIDALVGSGRRVVALDCRGHGESGKPHDPDAYAGTQMADDVIALMDYLEIDGADLMGYSMGGALSASLLVRHGDRFHSVIISGMGDALVNGVLMSAQRTGGIAAAMESAEGAASATPQARAFREFAERSGNDLAALSAMQHSRRAALAPALLMNVTVPVMVLVGDNDTLVGSGDQLTAAIPGAKLVKVPGDHLTAVGAPELKTAVLAFLAERSPVA